MLKFCPRCGTEIRPDDKKICPECGLDLRKEEFKNDKSPLIAGLCSFLLPGLGQVYNGNLTRGIGFLIGTIIGYFLLIVPGLIVWIYGIYDAYRTSGMMNAGRIPFSETSIVHMILFILFSIGISIILAVVIAVFIYGMSGGAPV